MFNSKFNRFLAAGMVFIILILSGCTAKKNVNASVENNNIPWAVTKYDAAEIIDGNGEYIIDELTPATVAELKTVGDKQVIYHLGKPYLFHAMHLRIDHLQSAGLDEVTLKSTFEEGMRRIKEAGYDTVILYLGWTRFYDGENYDFSEIEYQYSIAKKYDLKIMWNWFGYDVCGFGGYRDWQLDDLEKYPPLKDSNGNIMYGTGDAEGRPIPDLSVQSFIDIEVEALNQLCAWLNVNDTERRTIGIQLENEPNHVEGGHGLWFSQYEALANLLDELGRAIKEGPYSMITYLNLMSAGWDQLDENGEKTVFSKQIKGLIDKEYIDIVGYDIYTNSTSPSNVKATVVEQGDNPRLMVEFSPCAWAVPAQSNVLLSEGYGIGYYQVLLYNDTINSGGLYRFGGKNNPYVIRDGSQNLGGSTYNNELEVVVGEFILMNNSIKSLSELIAVSANENMTYFNTDMKINFSESKKIGDTSFNFVTDCLADRYGSTGLLIKANDNTYYTYASKTATITLDGGIKSASEGVYKDGKWVKTRDVEITDGVMTYEAGKAYQFII